MDKDTLATQSDDAGAETFDPRAMLAQWANNSFEWVRLLVAKVLSTGKPVGESAIETAYMLFRQENALDPREIDTVQKLSTEARQDEAAPPLNLVRLSEVRGVNALVTGAEIEPHEGLTILYGENGTGKTGYSRIFKALADSRTADVILGNVDADKKIGQSAKLDYQLGDDEHELQWQGDRGVSPFTRISIFDSPSVSTHVDDDLDYVYVPAALALFNHVIAAIQGVTAQIEATISTRGSGSNGMLSRFQVGSSVYPLIETLGASTDLAVLKAKASTDPDVKGKIDALTQTVAALRANTIANQLSERRREHRAIQQAADAAAALSTLNVAKYNSALIKRTQLAADYGASARSSSRQRNCPPSQRRRGAPSSRLVALIASISSRPEHTTPTDACTAASRYPTPRATCWRSTRRTSKTRSRGIFAPTTPPSPPSSSRLTRSRQGMPLGSCTS